MDPRRDETHPAHPAGQYPSAQFANVVAAVRELKHPTQVGPYLIQQVIGEGGMGTVYKAEQRFPIHRIVALKLIKMGMDTRDVIARFESERQALALMDHPNVARVLDAGATESGRPYFVMEYVAGEPITVFADRHKLTVPQRLELFVEACGAVQHAHQKAIIHRDLKPSNILVTVVDDQPHAKVIDFGVAKAISRRLTEKTLFTETGQLLGTPEYMAPEQAEGTILDVDTRADVYSLGVVLYELLSGTLPFDPKTLRSGGYQEIQRFIREVDPPRPSTRLSSLRDTLDSVAASRQLDAHKLGTMLRGELDWIVMKALEKDRTRRYDSASALAEDVQRYLADEPVSAGPPSRVYRARKFVRRHKLAIAMVSALAIALGAGLVGTAWGFVNARRQRDAAVVARNEAVVARDEAVAARKAEAEAREYETQTDKFLIDMFKSIEPEQARGRDVLVREILDDASRRIDSRPPSHKLVEAYLRSTFGAAYESLGLFEQARTQLERSLALESVTDAVSRTRIANTQNTLGMTYKELGKMDEAEKAYRKALELQRSVAGPDDKETISMRTNLGVVLIYTGNFKEAEDLLTDASERMRRVQHVDPYLRAIVANNLGMLRTHQGRIGEAKRIYRDALDAVSAAEGRDHPATIGLTCNLADLSRQEGNPAEAIELLAPTLELARKVYRPDHPDTQIVANNLCLAYQSVGRYADAEKLYRETIAQRRRTMGEDDPGTLLLRSNYGLLLQAMNRLDEAETEFRQTLELMRRSPDQSRPDRITLESNIAWLRATRGDFAEAESMYRKLIPEAQEAFDPQSPAPAIFGARLGFVLARQQKWSEAEPLLAKFLALARERGIKSPNAGFLWAHGMCLLGLNKPREALPVLERADQLLRAAPQPDDAMLNRIADAMANAYDQLGQPKEASVWRQKVTSRPTTNATSGPAHNPPNPTTGKSSTDEPTTSPSQAKDDTL